MKSLSLTIILLIILTSCISRDNISYEYPEDPRIKRKMRAGKMFSKNNEDLVVFGNKGTIKAKEQNFTKQEISHEIQNTNQNTDFPINKYLWRASLEIVSEKFPISLMDNYAGILATDWTTLNNDKNTRYKINVLVKGKELNNKNLIISVFKQKKDDANWDNVTLVDKKYTKIYKDKILSKARSVVGNQ